MTTDIQAIDALVQAISDAETRAGRDITEDEALAVARIMRDHRWLAMDVRFGNVSLRDESSVARAAYAAGRASAEKRVAELEWALQNLAADQNVYMGNGNFETIPLWHGATIKQVQDFARSALKGGSHD